MEKNFIYTNKTETAQRLLEMGYVLFSKQYDNTYIFINKSPQNIDFCLKDADFSDIVLTNIMKF